MYQIDNNSESLSWISFEIHPVISSENLEIRNISDISPRIPIKIAPKCHSEILLGGP